MATAPDLGKLRIDRDQPPPALSRAVKRAIWLAGIAVALIAALTLWFKRGSAVPVQVVTVTLGDAGSRGGDASSVGVVANGYVVARTKAAVSAKIAGRLASLTVSEGSQVTQGEVIA